MGQVDRGIVGRASRGNYLSCPQESKEAHCCRGPQHGGIALGWHYFPGPLQVEQDVGRDRQAGALWAASRLSLQTLHHIFQATHTPHPGIAQPQRDLGVAHGREVVLYSTTRKILQV